MILDELANLTRARIEKQKEQYTPRDIERDAEILAAKEMEVLEFDYPFEQALSRKGLSIISEVKKASPSKGMIAEDFPYLDIAKEYEAAGADCISVLTEPKWFLGSDAYLKEIAANVSIPCIRKDFTVDEYMIYEAKLLGARAVLLICSILTKQQISEYIAICDSLGISALVEAHDEAETAMAVSTGARIIGVNNRNLRNFSVDTGNSRRMRELVPKNIIFVSESGVSSASDIEALRQTGVDAVLIGEALMKAPDKRSKLTELRGNNDKNKNVRLEK